MNTSLLAALATQNFIISQQFMTFLALWAGANIVGGFSLTLHRRYRYFWQMMAMWNIFNLSLALISLLFSKPLTSFAVMEVASLLTQTQLFVAFNWALNLSYILIGLGLRLIGSYRQEPQLRGYGMAIVIQGAFLLAFDTALFWSHYQLLAKFIEKL